MNAANIVPTKAGIIRKQNKVREKYERVTIKCRLSSFYSNPSDKSEDILYKSIDNVNSIIEIGCLFMKGFILHTLENENNGDKILLENIQINVDFINIAFSVITKSENKGGCPFSKEKQNLINILTKYYDIFYEKTKIPKVVISCISYILHQEAEKIYISIINNIIFHIEKYISKYVKFSFRKEYDSIINDKEKRKEYYSNCDKIKTDILELQKNSPKIYHEWIDQHIKFIIPSTYTSINFELDVKNNTSKYIKCMYNMNKFFESIKIKMYNIFPTKNKTYNNYVKLNTGAIIDLFYGNTFNFVGASKLDVFAQSGNSEIQEKIWNTVFNLKNKSGKSIFKRDGFTFNYEMETDGYGVSLNFINNGEIAKKNIKKKNLLKGRTETDTIKNKIRNEILLKLVSKLENELKIDNKIDIDKDISKDETLQQILVKNYKNKLKDKNYKNELKLEIDKIYRDSLKEKQNKNKGKNEEHNRILKEKHKKEKLLFKEMIKKEKEDGTYLINEENRKLIKNEKAEFPYIEQILSNETKRDEFKTKFDEGNLIVCDPGKRSILYMMSCTNNPYTEQDKLNDKIKKINAKQIIDKNTNKNKIIKNRKKGRSMNNFGITTWKHHKILNYTSATRSHFTKRDLHNKLIDKWKNNLNEGTIPQNISEQDMIWYKKTLKEVERDMSLFNNKTNYHSSFLDFVIKRMEYLSKMKIQYNSQRMQQLKWYEYLNKNRHESELIRQIKTTFGKDITIIIGDWSGKGQIRHRPTPNLSLKRKLASEFPLYHIDEYLTSKLHNVTHERCENLYVTNPIKNKIMSAQSHTITHTHSTINVTPSNKVEEIPPSIKSPKNDKNIKLVAPSKNKKKVPNTSLNPVPTECNIIDKRKKDLNTIITIENNKTSTPEQKTYVLPIITSKIDPNSIISPIIVQDSEEQSLKLRTLKKKLHAVLTYKNVIPNTVGNIEILSCINRDKNSVLNMESIMLNLIRFGVRPSIFRRVPQKNTVKCVNSFEVVIPHGREPLNNISQKDFPVINFPSNEPQTNSVAISKISKIKINPDTKSKKGQKYQCI